VTPLVGMAGPSPHEAAVLIVVVAARLFLPLLIPRFPLVIVGVLVLDAVDQTLLSTFTGFDTSESGPYQSVDKGLDIYYLAIAYLATMRNWTSDVAFRISRFLFYYRLAGSVLFELTHARVMLLLFPNTFEYFFVVYEVVRLRYSPTRCSARFWLLIAAGIWIFVKLPQEYWIHIAQLDFTDTVRDYPAFGVTVVAALLGATCFFAFYVKPRLPAPDWTWRLAADPMPHSLVETHARFAQRLNEGRLAREALEQTSLLALLCIIFASILPDINATVLQIVLGITTIVLVNAAISLVAERQGGFAPRSAAARYCGLLATNLILVYAAHALLGDRRDFRLGYGLFFAFLITTILWLYDAFRPVYDARFADSSLRVTSIGDLFDRVRTRRS
jgi:hypothetical protein